MLTKKGKIFLTLLILVLLATAGAIYVSYFSNLLTVKNVRVNGIERLNEQRVLDLAQVEINSPLIELNPEIVANQILQEKLVKKVDVRKGWPDTLVIEIEERSPMALTDLIDGRYLVDETGVAFSRAGPDDVHLFVFAPNEAARGLAARVSRELPAWLHPEVSRVESYDAKRATVILNSGRRIVWGDEFKTDEKSSVLKVLLRTDEGDIDISTVEVPVLKTPAAQD